MGIPQAAALQSRLELVRLFVALATEKNRIIVSSRAGFAVARQAISVQQGCFTIQLLVRPVKCEVFNIRPKFLKKVTGQPARETIDRPDNRIMSISLTIDAPCV